HALRAHKYGHSAYARAGGEALGRAWTVVDELGAELVAHHHVAPRVHDERSARATRRLDQLLGELQGVQITSANSARERGDEHLAGPRVGRRDISNMQLVVEHGDGAHGGAS